MTTADTEQLVPPATIAKRFKLRLQRTADRVEFWRRVHDWGIPHYRLGPRTVMFSVADFDAWLKTRQVGKPATTHA